MLPILKTARLVWFCFCMIAGVAGGVALGFSGGGVLGAVACAIGGAFVGLFVGASFLNVAMAVLS